MREHVANREYFHHCVGKTVSYCTINTVKILIIYKIIQVEH